MGGIGKKAVVTLMAGMLTLAGASTASAGHIDPIQIGAISWEDMSFLCDGCVQFTVANFIGELGEQERLDLNLLGTESFLNAFLVEDDSNLDPVDILPGESAILFTWWPHSTATFSIGFPAYMNGTVNPIHLIGPTLGTDVPIEVSLLSPVPEPATMSMALVGFGALSIGAAWRRRGSTPPH